MERWDLVGDREKARRKRGMRGKGRVVWSLCSRIRVENRSPVSLALLQLKSRYGVINFLHGPGLVHIKSSYCVGFWYQQLHSSRSHLLDTKVYFFLFY